jgi:hypothetical protein
VLRKNTGDLKNIRLDKNKIIVVFSILGLSLSIKDKHSTF